jgi:hypothetical protein
MKVKRIVPNLAVSDPAAARRFYRDVPFGKLVNILVHESASE